MERKLAIVKEARDIKKAIAIFPLSAAQYRLIADHHHEFKVQPAVSGSGGISERLRALVSAPR